MGWGEREWVSERASEREKKERNKGAKQSDNNKEPAASQTRCRKRNNKNIRSEGMHVQFTIACAVRVCAIRAHSSQFGVSWNSSIKSNAKKTKTKKQNIQKDWRAMRKEKEIRNEKRPLPVAHLLM